ncbi:MAG: UDP-N-acetylglucosamine 1-carboxyvinyltransferase [Bacteroidetes bacterium]|nr:MAG: UDP-N-acetylglucosamine 1-carboxyvinyltransferase [Bacteroidota bacterium]
MISDSFEVIGGQPLKGVIVPQGAKNEALQVLSAVLLTEEPVRLLNLPDILDVQRMIALLEGLGVRCTRHGPNDWTFQGDRLDLGFFQSEDFQRNARRIRGSVMLIAPLLARFGRALLPQPGGDKIGRRRLDTHFHALQALGARVRFDRDAGRYFLEAERLRGRYLLMDEISVTGTANALMAAVLAEGTTTLYNAACEPYVQQLCRLLVRMGARIEGIGSNLLRIQGVGSLHGATHQLLPDFIEVGSFLGLAAMTRSEITIQGAGVEHLGNTLPVFRRLGLQFETRGDDLHIPSQDLYEVQNFMDGSILTIYDAPWPGFSPDLISVALVVATQARGSVLIHQKMFESRLFFVDKLIDMGAQIILCDPHRATVIGLERRQPLRGIEMTSPDIRAGVALLIAALSAQGRSVIHQIHQIDRGYEHIDRRLQALGAHIRRI